MEKKRIYFEEIKEDDHKDMLSSFKGFHNGFEYCGAVKMVLPKFREEIAKDFEDMEIYSDDLWIVTFPRTGTTWTQEIAWLLNNDMDFEKAKIPVLLRYSFIEFHKKINEEDVKNLEPSTIELFKTVPHFSETPRPRHMKSHFHLSLLPPSILNNSKVIYVARNPLDTVVSNYFHARRTRLFDLKADFKTYWGLVLRNLAPYNPYFDHVKQAWALRNHPNMFFVFYEDMQKDLPNIVRRMAKFLGKSYSDEEYEKLCVHVKFDNMKQIVTLSNRKDYSFANSNEPSFFRRGEVGAWAEYFDEEMNEQAKNWIAENLKGSDLKFPDFKLNYQNE